MLALHPSSLARFTIPMHERIPPAERTVFTARPATARKAIERGESIRKALDTTLDQSDSLAALLDAIAVHVVDPKPETLAESCTYDELWEVLWESMKATQLTADEKKD